MSQSLLQKELDEMMGHGFVPESAMMQLPQEQLIKIFFKAIVLNKVAIVDRFIEEKIDLNEIHENATPLLVAANQANLSILKKLIAAGADVHLQNALGCSALHALASAPQHMNPLVVKEAGNFLMEQGLSPMLPDKQNQSTPLHMAITFRWIDFAESMIDKCPEGIHLPDGKGFTALHSCIYYQTDRLLKKILSHKPVMNASDMYGNTPLHLAALKDATNVAQELVKHDAQMDAANREMKTPLFCAVELGNVNMAKWLVTNGADVNAVSSNGMTPLMVAVFFKQEELVSYLVKQGADIGKIDALGHTLLHYASGICAPQVQEKPPLETFALWLLDCGLNPLTKSHQGDLPLHPAARHSPTLVQKYLEAGSDPSAVGIQGMTPLHFAAASGCKETAEILLKAGASTSVENHLNISPLQYACSNGYKEVVEVMLDYPCELNPKDDAQVSPLKEAVKHGWTDLAEKMNELGAKAPAP